MEVSKSNENSPNKSTLSDNDKPPSPKITLFEKSEVVKLENMKLKEKQESNIQPDSTKEQKEAADYPPDLTEQQCLSEDDSSKDLLQGESKENICPAIDASDLTKEQAEASDTQDTEKRCHSRKNSMNSEFSNGKHPYDNGEVVNAPENLIEQQIEATDIHTEDSGLHTQNDSVKEELQAAEATEIHGVVPGPQLHTHKNPVGELSNEENPDKNGQGGNIPAVLVEEQTEATKLHVEEPKPELHIQNDSVKKELQTVESSEENVQGSNNPADLDKEHTKATKIHVEEPGPQLHIQKNSGVGELPSEENMGKNGQEGNTPADLVKEKTEATDNHADVPGPQLPIPNDSVKDELPTENSQTADGQEIKSAADLKEKQIEDLDGLPRIPEGNRKDREDNLKGELPVAKSLEGYLESYILKQNKDRSGDSFDDGSLKEHGLAHEDSMKSVCSMEKNYQSNTTLNLNKCQPESDENLDGKPEKHWHAKKDTPKEFSVGGPLRNDVDIENLPDLECDSFKLVEDTWEFSEHILSDSSKRLPPVYSRSTESVTNKNKICVCPESFKFVYPNECPTKFSVMQGATLVPLNCLPIIPKDPPEGDILDSKSRDETAEQSLDLHTDESEGEKDSQLVNLTGFSKEFFNELFINLNAEQDRWSENCDYSTIHSIVQESPAPQQSVNRHDQQSAASDVSRPLFPVPTVLANLQRKAEAHKRNMVSKLIAHDFLHGKDDAETQREFGEDFDKCVKMVRRCPDYEDSRVRQLFKDYPEYELGSPLKRARTPSHSSSDGLYASSWYGRYVRLSPTDVVSLKMSHFGFLTSLRNKLFRYSSSMKSDDGPVVVRSAGKLASYVLEAFGVIAEGMKEKVEDDIKFYTDSYITDTMGIENLHF